MNHPIERDRIFISYRRSDSDSDAGRLLDSMRTTFGRHRVFQDVEMPPGTPFPETLQSELDRSAVVLVVIGEGWLAAQDEHFRRRIDHEDDWVRTEIASGLNADVVVIPVLIGGASLPPADALPENIALLSRRNSYQVRVNRWSDDVAPLIEAIRNETGWSKPDTATVSNPEVRGLMGGVSSEPANLRSRSTGLQREIRIFGSPPNVTADFFGRAEQLAMLDATSDAVVTAVHGIGGVGKSQLAARYFRDNQSSYDFAAWIDLRLQGGRTDYAKLASHLGLPVDDKDPVELVRAYLKGTNERWLLVFDNADTPQDVEPLRPDNPQFVKTIVTSRYRHWAGYADPIPVDVFTPEQATQYLCTHTNRPHDQGAEDLAEALGYLPLALTIAGSYCLRARLAFGTYLAEYLPSHLDPANPNPDNSDDAIHQLWQQSLIAAAEQAPDVVPLAWLISVLDWSSIDRYWLVDHHPAGKIKTTEALALLDSFSLIDLTDKTLRITHNLIAKGLTYSADDTELQNLLESVFAGAVPTLDETGGDLTTADRYREAIRHLEYLTLNHPNHVTQALAPILNIAVRQQSSQEPQLPQWPEAVDQTIRALLGSEQPETLRSRNNLAISYRYVGRHEQAIAIFEQNVEDCTRILGISHPDTLWSINQLAVSYRNVGRVDEAITLFEQNFGDYIRVLGPDHPDTLWSLNNLAVSYRYVGRNDEAIAFEEQNLQDCIRVLGPDHPDTLWSRHNLAAGYRNVGRHAEAITLDEESVQDRTRVLGPNHPSTLWSRHNLAVGYSNVGRHDEAIELFEQNLQDRTRILGPEHPDTLWSRNNLAVNYSTVGRHDEAIELFDQNLQDRTRILGPNHPDTLWSRHNLAWDYCTVRRNDEAIPLEEQNLRDRTRILGADHPDTLWSRNNLAVNYSTVGRHDEAIELFDQNLQDRTRILGPNHPDTLRSRHSLAWSYNYIGRYDKAIPLAQENLRDRIRVLGPEHPDTLWSQHDLAWSYSNAGRYDEAITLDEQNLQDRIRILGPEHPSTLWSRHNLAAGYRKVGRYDEAITLYEQNLQDRTRILGPNHPDTLRSRESLDAAEAGWPRL